MVTTPTVATPAATCGFCGDAFPCSQCKLHKRLGRGAFGEVWAATVCGKAVALKVLKVCPETQEFPTVHHTALVELQACATRGFLTPDRAWLHPGSHTLTVSMPRAACDVQALETLGRPPLPAVAAVAAAITHCLTRMHGRGFMHRDVTAKNVLVMQDGSSVVCDKSLVRRLWGTSVLRSCYTPKVTAFSYRAPELLANATTPMYDERVDVWGLGCVVAELLLQDLLFEFMSEQTLAHLGAALLVSGSTKWPHDSIPVPKEELRKISQHVRELRATFGPIRTMVHNHWKRLGRLSKAQHTMLAHAADFCAQCLQFDPTQRPSAAALRRHPFLRHASQRAMARHLTRLHATPRTLFSSTGHRVVSPPLARGTSVSSSGSASSGGGGTAAAAEGLDLTLQDIACGAVEIPLAQHSAPSRAQLQRIAQFPALRVAMADSAARLLWPPGHLPARDKPAAWSCFATAMHLCDELLVRLPTLAARLAAQPVDAPEPLSFILACCVLAAQREGRMFAIAERMCPQERRVTTAALQSAVATIVVGLHGATLPFTMVDAALTHATEREACVVAAAYASMSPQLLGRRGTSSALHVQRCMSHQLQLLQAFQNITGLDAWTGKAPVALPMVTHTVVAHGATRRSSGAAA